MSDQTTVLMAKFIEEMFADVAPGVIYLHPAVYHQVRREGRLIRRLANVTRKNAQTSMSTIDDLEAYHAGAPMLPISEDRLNEIPLTGCGPDELKAMRDELLFWRRRQAVERLREDELDRIKYCLPPYFVSNGEVTARHIERPRILDAALEMWRTDPIFVALAHVFAEATLDCPAKRQRETDRIANYVDFLRNPPKEFDRFLDEQW